MDILIRISSYIIAYLCILLKDIPLFPITLLFRTRLYKIKKISPFIIFLFDVAAVAGVIFLAIQIIEWLDCQPSWLMFIIPGIMMIWNDRHRLYLAKKGLSKVRHLHELNKTSDSYDHKHDIYMETAHLIGDFLGWTIGTILWLKTTTLL